MKTALQKPIATSVITLITAIAILKIGQHTPTTTPNTTPTQQPITEILPPPTQECSKNGCGYIDFDSNPQLIGGAIVYEPENKKTKTTH